MAPRMIPLATMVAVKPVAASGVHAKIAVTAG
jgi:hypothetical protein